MDEDEGNALEEFSAELEEHLYAKIHHEQVESAPRAEAPRMASGGGQKMGNGRYFGTGGASGKSWVKKSGKRRTPILGIDKAPPIVGGRPPAKKTTLYESFLEGLRTTSDATKSGSPGNLRKNPARLFRKPDVPPPGPPVTKVSPKRDRAKKNRRKDKKKLPTIVLDSSEDERDDDVVEVPVPAPPLVCLDSSDESETPRKVARRTASPSSSILSDDFIAAQDRRRLEALDVADEELRTVQRQSTSPGKPQAPLSDISTSDSEDFLPDEETEEPKRLTRKRQKRSPTPKETPFILRGEALPNAVSKARKSIDTMSSHRSDEEFMTILNTIAIGEASNEPLEIPDSPDGESTDIVINIDGRKETPEPENELPEDESETDGSQNEVPESPEEIPEHQNETPQTPEEIPGGQEEEDELPNLLHGWNEEMRRFYEESWGGEKFSMQNIIGQMPDNNQWQISPRDFNFSRFHRTWREPQELKLVCYMCGDSGHREPRCPNTLCLRCGSRAMVFGFACGKCSDWSSGKCDICQTHGHKAELCPDLWRRYHATVEDVAPEAGEQGALNEPKWCSICAKMGHTADSCPCPVRILEYPASPWKVSSYEAVYEKADKDSNPPDPFHTYRGERVRFLWSDTVRRSQFYERFLSHCGVERSTEVSEVAPEVEEPEVAPEAPSVIQKDNAESKIVLHRDYCKHLMSPRGQEFLKALADEMCVEVNLRTSPAGNLLRLRGEKGLLEDFRQRTLRFLGELSREKWRTMEEGKRLCLPVTRVKMIEKVKRNLTRLQFHIGNVHELYGTMCSKATNKRVGNDARTRLNMILMGQVGLREGRSHVRALEGQVAMLQRQQQIVEVPHAMRNTMNEHYRYIFSAVKHKNYPAMIRQFNVLMKQNKLPPMAVPRQDRGKSKRN